MSKSVKAADNRSPAARVLRKGDRVRHLEFGPATVLGVRRADGAVFIRVDADGIEGTCSATALSWER